MTVKAPAMTQLPLWRRLLKRVGILPIVLVLTCVVVALYEPRFLRTANLINILRNASFLSIVSAGQMFVIIAGGFDVSIGAVVAITSVSVALLMNALDMMGYESQAFIVLAGFTLGILPALVIGLINGTLVAVMRISPFMVTIGTMSVALGIAFYVTGGAPVYDLPDLFTRELGRGRIFRIPYIVFVAAAILLCVWFFQSQTKFGRYIYAVGGNANAARLTGIKVAFYTGITYVISALLAGVTGFFLTARVGSGESNLGEHLTLESIAAVIIAGVSLKGGVGRIQAVIVSAIFLSVLSNAMNIMRIESRYQAIGVGIIILIAVAFERISGSKNA